MMTLAELATDLDELGRAGDVIVDRALDVVAEAVADRQRQLVAVRTGETRRSISVERLDDGGRIVGPDRDGFNPTDVHLEYGTARTPAQPFVLPSADFAEVALPRQLLDELAEVLR